MYVLPHHGSARPQGVQKNYITAEIADFYTLEGNDRTVIVIELFRLLSPQRNPDREIRFVHNGQITFLNLKK
jgi:hypothetical protein